jgi:hypothetical protein
MNLEINSKGPNNFFPKEIFINANYNDYLKNEKN